MKRLNDLLSGKENIKVASVDTPMITSNQRNLLSFEVNNNDLLLGDNSVYMSSVNLVATSLYLYTTINGDISIDGMGLSLTSAAGMSINCNSPLKLSNYITAQRPTTNEGSIIYDSTLKKCILYNGTDWVNLDGTALS